MGENTKIGIWGDDGVRVKSKSFVANLRKWQKSAAERGVIESVFPSLCDPFEDRPELEPWRNEMFTAIDECPNLRLLLLTKRPENIRRMVLPYTWHACETGDCPHDRQTECASEDERKYRDNVWLGTSISDQASADKQIPELLQCRDLSPVLFLSAEPLLGPIDLRKVGTTLRGNDHDVLYGWVGTYQYKARHASECSMGVGWTNNAPKVDWVIAGGESGPNARPMHPDWARGLRDQCQAAGVAFLFKQWGEWMPSSDEREPRQYGTMGKVKYSHRFGSWLDGTFEIGTAKHPIGMLRVGKEAAGRMLDGREWNEFPQPVEV